MSESFGPGAAFDVFAKRERSGVLLQAVLGYVLLSIVFSAAFLALTWSSLGPFFATYMSFIQSSMGQGTPSEAQTQEFLRTLLPLAGPYFIMMVVTYLLLAAFEAAVHRWLVRGETGGFLGLTLGADTWRVYLSYWLWLLVGIVLYVAFLIVGLIIGVVSAVVGVQGAIGVAFVVIAAIAACIPFIYVLLRLAPASATSIGRKRFAFFDAWRVTEGRALSMLGAFLIIFALFFVAYLAFAIAFGIIIAIPLAGMTAAGAVPDPQMLFAELLQPAMLAPIIAALIAYTVAVFVLFLALMGVNARAVRVALQEGRIEAAA